MLNINNIKKVNRKAEPFDQYVLRNIKELHEDIIEQQILGEIRDAEQEFVFQFAAAQSRKSSSFKSSAVYSGVDRLNTALVMVRDRVNDCNRINASYRVSRFARLLDEAADQCDLKLTGTVGVDIFARGFSYNIEVVEKKTANNNGKEEK